MADYHGWWQNVPGGPPSIRGEHDFSMGWPGNGVPPELLAQLQPLIIQAISEGIRNSPEIEHAIDALMAKKFQRELTRGIDPQGNLGRNAKNAGTNSKNINDLMVFGPRSEFGEAGGYLKQEEPMLSGGANIFRRGGVASRAHSSFTAIMEEQNFSGFGRAANLLMPTFISPFITLIVTRWLDEWKKIVDGQVTAEIEKKVGVAISKINIGHLLNDLKKALQEDPDFRKNAAANLFDNTREAEKNGRGAGWWLRGGPFPGVR